MEIDAKKKKKGNVKKNWEHFICMLKVEDRDKKDTIQYCLYLKNVFGFCTN